MKLNILQPEEVYLVDVSQKKKKKKYNIEKMLVMNPRKVL